MNSGPTLQMGSTGPDVRRLQILFVMTKLLDYTGIDGNFGPQTQEVVKSFQQSSNHFGPRRLSIAANLGGIEDPRMKPPAHFRTSEPPSVRQL
jgi:hypothetical protein